MSAVEVEAPAQASALEAEGIVKTFDGVVALNHARFSVRPGEIHALLGENGAGKSTLIKVLTGLIQPDAGEVRRNGEPLTLPNVRAAHKAGIAALPQELSIVSSISVAENIVMGETVPSSAGLVSWRRLYSSAREQLDRLGQRINPRKLAGELSPVEQTMVAVARALATDARILILDEPTAALTDTEIQDLFAVLRVLREEGVSIVFVSHRLEEVFELCDRLTIMRNGETIITKDVADSTADEVISTMVGRPSEDLYPDRNNSPGSVVLDVENLSGKRVQNVSFQARAGEVVGIGGLAGSGRSELLRILSGAQKRSEGIVRVDGDELAKAAGVGRALQTGIGLVPEERRSQGIILAAPIRENIALANLPTVSTAGLVSGRQISSLARSSLNDLRIKARGPGQPVGQLSGGNQQKVVLAKILARQPKVLLMDEPTRGIDVGTKAEIYRLIRSLAEHGTTVVTVSSELPELMGLSDRILIMHEGRLSGEVPAEKATEELLLSFCYGRASHDADNNS